MSSYILQLLSDLEAAIHARWKECPPHYFEMGMPERFLEPPTDYDGPPFGFGIKTEDPSADFSWQEKDDSQESMLPSQSEQFIENLNFEASISEMEQWLEETPPVRCDMYYHFGFEPEQFPQAGMLSDNEIENLVLSLCRLWATYNFTPVFPAHTPGRVLYPLLLQRMSEPTFVMTRGNNGIEFCEYAPEQCPFGEEWCTCKDE